MENYVVYHLHSNMSITAGIDSVTWFQDYVTRAKECGMKAIGFSEHGNIYDWTNKKRTVEAAGMKFIFAVEAYLTESLNEKIRDNYHCVLIAKNETGKDEICSLISNAGNKDDGHFYYNPRITFDELFATSDNVLITTACLAGPLYSGTESAYDSFLDFIIENKDRCYLEVQHHPNAESQKEYNRKLLAIHYEYGIPLIAGTDTHCLNKEHEAGRVIMQKAKNVHFNGEDEWDLTWKTYDELVDSFKEQGVLSYDEMMEAIENTNKMADRIEPWELDTSIKYPHIYDNADQVFKDQINKAYKKNKYARSRYPIQEVREKVHEEYAVYEKVGAIDFMLLETYLLNWERKNGIKRGYGRGSVSGSMIAYLLGITEMDSMRFNLNFFRFLNPSRVTNSDIDVDYANEDREKIKKFLLKDHMGLENIHTAEIITFNTIALKGAIKDVGRALEIPLNEVDEISKAVYQDENKKWAIDDKWRKKYPELFKYVDIVNGTIVSVGTHPSGVLVTDFDIGKAFGTCHLSTTDYPVCQIDMHQLDYLMCVKLDILGLDNIGVINEACDLAGIERYNPDNVDLNDEKVWKDIREDTTGIFQWESASAQAYIKKFMSDENIKQAKERSPNFSYIKWFSFGNGLLRPGCADFRDDVANGNYYDNGLKELNDFLGQEAGHVCMQETIMQFLVRFCGYSDAESDNVRRAIAKKKGTKDLLPEIERRFIEYTPKHYNATEEQCKIIIKPFISSIERASLYAFSWNHSDAYSCVGYISGYLRYYYPLEFFTAALNMFADDEKKTNELTDCANRRGVKISPIKFRHSLDKYTIDKESNTIYKGMGSIKYLNKRVGKEFYKLRNDHFDSFIDLLVVNNAKKITDSRQMDILIKLDFFSEFGNPNQLLEQVKIFNEYVGSKQLNKAGMDELIPHDMMLGLCEKETEKKYVNVDWFGIVKLLSQKTASIKTPISDRIKYEAECLGYIQLTMPDLKPEYVYVLDIDGKFANKTVTLYVLKTGQQRRLKAKARTLESRPIVKGNILRIDEEKPEGRWSKDENGKWVQSKTDFEDILKKYVYVR